jgi:hypothetical protein
MDGSSSEEDQQFAENEVCFKKIEEIPNAKKIPGSQYGFPESTVGKRRSIKTGEGEEKKKRKTVSIHSGMFI